MTLKQDKRKQLTASLLLTLAAFIWGSAFVAQSEALDILGHFTFLMSRSFFGVLTLIPVSVFIYKKGQKSGVGENGEYKSFFSKDLLLGGSICGLVLFIASALQQVGIISSGVGKSGFLTTLYILAVPVLGLFLKRKIKPFMWVCIALGVIGMYFLCVSETSNSGIETFDELAAALKNDNILMAMGNSDVPVGQYTQKILAYYGLEEKELASNGVVSYGSNVKEVTTQISEGSVDCGVIYCTDAFSTGLTIKDYATAEMCGQVIYPAAVLNVSENQELAKDFLVFIQTDACMEIFEEVGFSKVQ